MDTSVHSNASNRSTRSRFDPGGSLDTSLHSSGSKHGKTDELNSLDNLIECARNGDKDAKKRLKKRKKHELKLVKKYDKSTITAGKECWFLVDSQWLNKWSKFVNGDLDEDSPNIISTRELLDDDKKPLPRLQAKIDYRGLSPMVYHILVELYGKDSSPELPRYTIDIYKPEIPLEKLAAIKMTTVMDARIQVNKVRPKWMKWDIEFEEEEEEDAACCCGLTKEHLEAFIYWAIQCWSRRKSGRGDISYRQYKPLTAIPDDTIHGNSNSIHGDLEHGRYNRETTEIENTSLELTSGNLAKMGRQLRKAEKYNQRAEELDDSSDDDSSVSSSGEIQFEVAPADMGYERGTWVNNLLWGNGSSHGSSHGYESVGATK